MRINKYLSDFIYESLNLNSFIWIYSYKFFAPFDYLLSILRKIYQLFRKLLVKYLFLEKTFENLRNSMILIVIAKWNNY